MMKKRYYIAYGSNLNVRQMRMRCPDATILGTARLDGWELKFRGSMTGSYLTIEKKEGGKVPIAVWEVSESDEASLDRYEGCPGFYYKKDFRIKCRGIRTGRIRTVDAFAYIMHEDRPIGVPASCYMKTCLDGYDAFRFDRNVLMGALEECERMCGYEGQH